MNLGHIASLIVQNPPGNAAYNVAKAAIKAMTEHLSWELRQDKDCKVTAHMLVPGWTYTGLTGATPNGNKPDGAWTPEQVIEFMLDGIDKKQFYLICPDNAVTREVDNARMLWNVDDIVKNRPALSRWSEEHKDEFEAFVQQKLKEWGKI